MRQFELWKGRPAGFKRDNWFVIVSGNDRVTDARQLVVNGVACFSMQGDLRDTDVYLNGADGLAGPTACQCDFLFTLEKSALHSPLGTVSVERQRQIKARIKDVLRLH